MALVAPSVGNGFGPARNVVCVDFDGTIIKWADLDDTDPELQPGVVEAMRAMKAAGKRLFIFTSRMSPRYLESMGRMAYDQYHHVADILRKNGIPFDDIVGEKVPAEAYIDDMAVAFRGDWAASLAELGIKPLEHARARAERRPDGRTWCTCGWVGKHGEFRAHYA